MAHIAEKHLNRLKDIKATIEQSYQYFKDNNDRYHEFIKFVFQSSMTQDDLETLEKLGKPQIEFNILESFVSRLRGEFAKQQPSLTVRANDGIPVSQLTPEFTKTIDVIEAYLRAIFFDANNDKLEYQVYSDLLAGGFSVLEVYTDYVHENSFEQNIYVDRVFDPTLTGFDPLARTSHKGDGKYCFQLYPMTKKAFEAKYGSKLTDNMSFSKNVSGFGFSYRSESEEIVLVCDYYEKKYKEEKILLLTNGQTVTEKEYEKIQQRWIDEVILDPIPEIVKERKTTKESIVRYRLCESEVLDYTETNYKHLPLVFVDGNSVIINDGQQQYQMTRPYVYHAKGVQRLKNFAGQSLANELENIVQHKFMVAIESIPEKYKEAYQNVQKQNTLIYHHFLDETAPEITLPPPQPVARQPIPPEITNTFRLSDDMTQVILGSYDVAQGTNRGDLSGAAIAMGAIQSNNASVPYIVGYIKGLNRVAQIIVDLIPKYYRTPRTLPVLLPSGKRSYEVINKAGSIYMNYDPNSLQVKVQTGVNFAIQKELAMKTITGLMQSSQGFAEFINQEGLSMLLDNIDIRGIDELKSKAEKWEQNKRQEQQSMQQMQQQMQQMQMQLSQMSAQAKVQKTQAEAAKAIKEAQAPTKTQIDAEKLELEKEKAVVDAQQKQERIDLDEAKTLAELHNKDEDQAIREAEISAENARTQVETLKTAVEAQKAHNELKEIEKERVD